MRKKFSGTPIARYQVFTLADGSYVVQWDDKHVQELLSGKYREFEQKRDFGHSITEWELKRLKAAGCVEHYNREYVWLYALPEKGRYGIRKERGRGDRIRTYYLSTTLPKSQLNNVKGILEQLGVADFVELMPRQSILVVMAKDGSYFPNIEEAEQIHELLTVNSPDLFAGLTIGFDDVNPNEPSISEDDALSLDELIASQNDTSFTSGRQIVMAVNEEEEREVFDNLFTHMEIVVQHADSGVQALEILEDSNADLLLMDLILPDMHSWQMIRKIKEVESLRTLPIMVITNELNIAMTVAQVDYLTRPVSIARLRHNVWKILMDRASSQQIDDRTDPRNNGN